ncbi:MAG: radical SAM protein [Thermodesulfobacteriota bacterium]
MTAPAQPLAKTVVRDFNRTRSLFARGAICHVPFKSLYCKPGGEVLGCCLSDRYVLGVYPEQSLRDIWKGERIRALREAILGRDLSLACAACRNQLVNGNFAAFPGRWCDGIPWSRRQPTALEFQLGNTCNLECVMCFGIYSSSVRKNREKLPELASPYGPAFEEEVGELVPGLAVTRFSGGEPFLMEIYHRIWERIVARNPRCRIHVNTNGTVLNTSVRSLLSRAAFDIVVSLDSLDPETFAAIRVNAELGVVLENIAFFRRHTASRNRSLSISFCLIRQNWKELPAVVRYCNEIGASLTVSPSYYPTATSLRALPPGELETVSAELSRVRLPAGSERERFNRHVFESALMVVNGWLHDARELGREISWEEFSRCARERFERQIELESRGLPPEERARGLELCREKFQATVLSVSARRTPTVLHKRIMERTNLNGAYEVFTTAAPEVLESHLEKLLDDTDWWW